MKSLVLLLAATLLSASAMANSKYVCKNRQFAFELTVKPNAQVMMTKAPTATKIGWAGLFSPDATRAAPVGYLSYSGGVGARCLPTQACPKYYRLAKAFV